ncbi:MAG: GNAT family N-acetyltransferase [Pseudobacter sp.]|uniref:GNAT family N-acetyltransferase n=1 Tax=Pseudobacter sp. TaxID=2045420 RepID=UPI003F810D97
MQIAETNRFLLRQLRPDDAAFVLEIVNSPGWLRFIGDRGVRDLEGAGRYIRKNVNNYQALGFGLYAIEMKDSGEVAGMCGLLKRDYLPTADIGYALLPRFEGLGIAQEAGRLVINYAQVTLQMTSLFAIVTPQNSRSISLLEKLRFHFSKEITENNEQLLVFEWTAPSV